MTRRVLGPEYSTGTRRRSWDGCGELELLGRVVAAAEGGSGGVALVEGEPGIGKTYVLEALAARAAGSVVLRGRAWEEGGTPPAWPWREVTRTLGAVVAWDHPPDRFAMFEHVATALRDASAAGPLLVLLDDLHAADDDALALTRYVAVSIREAPIALVLAGQPSPRLASLARDWVQVRLGPLSTAEILILADQTAPALLRAQTREDIVRIAEGNPLVAHELALAGDSRTGLPERLRDAVLARVAELAGPVREVLDAAAVLGRQFDLEDVAGMLGADVDDLIARLGASAGARLVAAVTGTGWQFRHQVIRDALYESVPIPARLELHAAAARHLPASGAELRLDEAEIHVLQLASPTGDRQREPQSRHALLDEKAKAAYRERITDLRQELQEAEDNNDFERADHIRAELDLIVDELRRAVGLGGRSRTVTNDAERARVAVRKAITTALDRLAQHDTTFAQHLRIHIRTGIYCHYQTDPTNPIEWNVST